MALGAVVAIGALIPSLHTSEPDQARKAAASADAPLIARVVPDEAPSAATTANPTPATSALPAGTDATEEREAERQKALEIRGLVAAGRIGKARAETSRYYERFPNGESAAELERLTGVHRTGR